MGSTPDSSTFYGYTTGTNTKLTKTRQLARRTGEDLTHYDSPDTSQIYSGYAPTFTPPSHIDPERDYAYDHRGTDSIEKIYKRVMTQDASSVLAMSKQWQHVHDALAEMLTHIGGVTDSMAPKWQSAGADLFRAMGPGATLKSIDDWILAAGSNVSGLATLAGVITAQQKKMTALYAKYKAAQADCIKFFLAAKPLTGNTTPVTMEDLTTSSGLNATVAPRLLAHMKGIENAYAWQAQVIEADMATGYFDVATQQLGAGTGTRFEGPTNAVADSPGRLSMPTFGDAPSGAGAPGLPAAPPIAAALPIGGPLADPVPAGGPGVPGLPGAPERPGVPGLPGVPSGSGASGEPNAPNLPNTPAPGSAQGLPIVPLGGSWAGLTGLGAGGPASLPGGAPTAAPASATGGRPLAPPMGRGAPPKPGRGGVLGPRTPAAAPPSTRSRASAPPPLTKTARPGQRLPSSAKSNRDTFAGKGRAAGLPAGGQKTQRRAAGSQAHDGFDAGLRFDEMALPPLSSTPAVLDRAGEPTVPPTEAPPGTGALAAAGATPAVLSGRPAANWRSQRAGRPPVVRLDPATGPEEEFAAPRVATASLVGGPATAPSPPAVGGLAEVPADLRGTTSADVREAARQAAASQGPAEPAAKARRRRKQERKRSETVVPVEEAPWTVQTPGNGVLAGGG